jgi:hypothetical protein
VQKLHKTGHNRLVCCYGWQELDAIANHHMLLCNRAKTKLSNEEKSLFDGTLKQLQQIMDVGTSANEKISEADKGKQVELGVIDDNSEFKSIREAGVAKAAEMAAGYAILLLQKTLYCPGF